MSEYILTHKYHTHTHAASGWRIHCGVEVTELSTNKQHTLSLRKLLRWKKIFLYIFMKSLLHRKKENGPLFTTSASPAICACGGRKDRTMAWHGRTGVSQLYTMHPRPSLRFPQACVPVTRHTILVESRPALKVSFNRPRPSLTRVGCHGRRL